MFKCYIIDDESHAIETLKKYAKDCGQLEIMGTSQNPLQGMKYINEHKNIDITFLDVDMPDISGLDVADLIYKNTAIIFTTGHAGYAVEGFDKNVSDFMLKPISFQRFLKSLNKVTARLLEKKELEEPKNEKYFFVNPGIKGKMLKMNYDDVHFIEGMNNYIVIHAPDNNQVIYLTMREMELGMPKDTFIRIHKSYVVNISKVTMMEGNKIYMGKVVLPIGASYKEKVLQMVSNHTIKTTRQ